LQQEVKGNKMETKAAATQGADTLRRSPTWQVLNFERWVRTVLLSQILEEGDAVLDLMCGARHNKTLWATNKIAHYTGVGKAELSFLYNLLMLTLWQMPLLKISLPHTRIGTKLKQNLTPPNSFVTTSKAYVVRFS